VNQAKRLMARVRERDVEAFERVSHWDRQFADQIAVKAPAPAPVVARKRS
jgi:hypothetical protein